MELPTPRLPHGLDSSEEIAIRRQSDRVSVLLAWAWEDLAAGDWERATMHAKESVEAATEVLLHIGNAAKVQTGTPDLAARIA